MDLLSSLGITPVAGFQFLIFVGLLTFLSLYVFSPYVHAFEERQKRTKGGEVLAEEYQHKTTELQSAYQDKAREVHGHISAIFQRNRSEALADYDKIVNQAKKEAQSLIENNRQGIAKVVQQTSDDLRSQTTSVALAITNKLLGKS